MQLDRRSFLKTTGAAAALTLGGIRCATRQPEAKLPPLGIQLYTVRDAIAEDFQGTLTKIADMGYAGVETYFFPEEITLKQAGDLLNSLELPVCAMHTEIPEGDQKDLILRMAEAYQSDRLVWHGWPQSGLYASMDAMKETVERYNKASQWAKDNGLKFGMHNHWWEFQQVDGVYPAYYLLENLNPDIFFEIDVYWTRTAGQDPAKVVADFGKRAPLLHIKDGKATVGEPVHKQVAVGQGNVDIPAVAEAGKGSTEWMIVELDDTEYDIFDMVQQSYTYLTENGFARGKV
ncbi:MAG: TIM barrel protein [candidate division KSB1 bacterium]|nr:TIM barrel protein [candidate division KSB1 bacterium]